MMESSGGREPSTPDSKKKRKRAPSLSPRRGKRKLGLDEVRKHVSSPSQKSKGRSDAGKSTPTPKKQNSIKSFFANAKPPQYTTCPVCEEQVKLSEINTHLDSGCLVNNPSPAQSTSKAPSPENERRVADMRTEVKDKRTRRRLQDKFDSSPLYRHSSSSSASDDGRENSTKKGQHFPGVASAGSNVQRPAKTKSAKYGLGSGGDSHSAKCDKKDNSSEDDGKLKGKSRLSLRKIRETRNALTATEPSLDPNNLVKKEEINVGTDPQSDQESKKTSPYFKAKGAASLDTMDGDSSKFAVKKEYSKNQCNAKGGTVPYDQKESASTHQSSLSHIQFPKTVPTSSTSTSGLIATSVPSRISVVPHTPTKVKPSDMSKVERGERTPQKQRSPYSSACKSRMVGTPSTTGRSNHVSPSRSIPQSSPTPTNPSNTQGRSSTVPISPLRSSKPGTSAQSNMNSTPTRGNTLNSPARSSSAGVSPARSEGLGSPHKPREPYYMVNFKLILNSVLKNEFDAHLFNEEDHEQIARFNNLSGPAQQLYVRLFQRKFHWFRVNKIEYPRIASDLRPYVKQLIDGGLVMTEKSIDDLAATLKLLMAPDLKQLAKDFKVGGATASTQKNDLVAAILKYSSSQRSMFSSNMNGIVLKKAKKFLGHCIKLTVEPRTVFRRILMLFSLVRQDLLDEDKGSAGQSALQTELLVNMGKMSYPVYTVYRTRSFFATREELLRYEVAMQYESDIADALAINDFALADKLQKSAMDIYKESAENEETLRHDESLPQFLRCFTASWIYTRIRYQGVDIKQKQRRYSEAVDMLRGMLEQTLYCADRRGGWWDRLALNLDQHCKKQGESLDCIKQGLADPFIRIGHKLALQQRAQKILKSKKKQLAERAGEFQFDDVIEIPKVVIKGTVLPHHGPGVRNTFISSYQGATKGDEGIVVCSVEQVALEHYKDQGYTEGTHSEGTTYSTLIFVLFWDIVFKDNIPDVFCYPYQCAPLDLRTDHFYNNRYDAIQQKLGEIQEADTERLQAMLQTNWLEYEGDMCVGVSWDVFRDLDHAKGLLACIGGRVLSAIAERILRDHRHCRAGRPDLTMWNPEEKKFRLVEVKGPGDRLSQKQILWIDFFLRHGVEAEVCLVEAVGSKQLKKKIYDSQDAASTSSSSQESRASLD